MSVLELKQEYNTVLTREKKAEVWISKATNEQIDKWLPEYDKIIRQLGSIIIKIENTENIKLTDKEILNGFTL